MNKTGQCPLRQQGVQAITNAFHKCIHTHTHTHTNRHTHKHRHTNRHTNRHTHTHTESETQRDTHTDRKSWVYMPRLTIQSTDSKPFPPDSGFNNLCCLTHTLQ